MGTREHEQHIKTAARTSVDAIQSANVPRVSLDEGYKEILEEMLDGKSNREMETAFERAAEECIAPAALAGTTVKDSLHHKRRRKSAEAESGNAASTEERAHTPPPRRIARS